MAESWEKYRDILCQKLENDFGLPFDNKMLPITALTSNDRIAKDADFGNHMKIGGRKDLAAIGDTVIDFLIMEHFLDNTSPKSAQELNEYREKYGKNKMLHKVSKAPNVCLKNYILRTPNDRCWETGTRCLAEYFEALVAIIFIEHKTEGARNFFQKISFFETVEKMYELN